MIRNTDGGLGQLTHPVSVRKAKLAGSNLYQELSGKIRERSGTNIGSAISFAHVRAGSQEQLGRFGNERLQTGGCRFESNSRRTRQRDDP